MWFCGHTHISIYIHGTHSHSAQRAILRSLDHANNAHEAEAMELEALMKEFDTVVKECGAMKVRVCGLRDGYGYGCGLDWFVMRGERGR